MQDYKSMCAAATICATLVNIQTYTQTHRQTAFGPAYMNSSANWAKNCRCFIIPVNDACLTLLYRSMEALVRCFTDVANASCGDRAATWMFTYKSRLINPVKWKVVANISSKQRLPCLARK